MAVDQKKRQDLILKYIVEDFIETAEPVGSNNLLERHALKMSSATVRNVMGQLEKKGLIEKPHTSAGRVPSTAGYRYYVENLGSDGLKAKAGQAFQKEFALVFKSKTQSLEDTISKACEVLSQVTSLAILVLGNAADNESLVAVNMVPLSNVAATVILLTNEGHVENKTFAMPQGASVNAVAYGVKLLNERLKGTKISELEGKCKALEPILKTEVGKDSKIVMEAFAEAFLSFAKKRAKAFGISNLLALPEFRDNSDFRKAISGLAEDTAEQTADMVEANVAPNTKVSFGKDEDVAMVSQLLSLPGFPNRELAVVGPKRMDYRKVILALQFLSKAMGEYFGVPELTDGCHAPPDTAKGGKKSGNPDKGRKGEP